MSQKIKLPKRVLKTIKSIGTVVSTKEDKTYICLPHWFVETDEDGVVELFYPDNLPDDLIKSIKYVHNHKN